MRVTPRYVDGTMSVRLFELMESAATVVGGLGEWKTEPEFREWLRMRNQ